MFPRKIVPINYHYQIPTISLKQVITEPKIMPVINRWEARETGSWCREVWAMGSTVKRVRFQIRENMIPLRSAGNYLTETIARVL